MWPDLILDQETELTVTGHWCCVWVHKRHQGGKKEKENGRAIHRAGNHTINLTVFLSTACSLPFSFTNFEGEKKKKRSFYSLSFPPLTFPLNLQIHWLTPPPPPLQTLPPPLPSCPPLPPLVGRLRWAVAHYSTWQRRPPFFCHFTFTQTANLLHFPSNFQMNFTGTDWRSPFTSLFTISLCFCFQFSFRELYWHHSMTVTLLLSLSLSLVALSLALYCQFKQPLWHSAYKRFNTGWPECVNPNKPGWLKCIAIMKMFFCTLYFLDLRPFLLFKSSLHLFSFVFPRLFLLFYLFLCSFLH